MPKQDKSYISRATKRKWATESYQAEVARYDFAKELFERLKEEVKRKEAERKAILAEREQDETARIQAQEKLNQTENNVSVAGAVPATETVSVSNEPAAEVILNTKIDAKAKAPQQEKKKPEKDSLSFWSSLWLGLMDSFRKPVSVGFAPVTTDVKEIKARDKAQLVYWTKDAVSAYNILKNKVEISKYTGDIVANKEKQQYANVVNTYADNVSDYLDALTEYNSLSSNYSPDAMKRKSELRTKMNQMASWLNDLDDLMKVAMSYDMTYGNPLKGITSYSASIGAGNYSGERLQEDAKRLYNAYRTLKNGNETDSKNIERTSSALDVVRNGYGKYSKKLNDDNLVATKKMDDEIQDLKEWEEWHTPSAEFRAREKAALNNYLFDWDTYAYAFPGTLGSSMSFGGVQMLSTTLNMLGGIAIQTGNPYAVAGGVVATLTGAGLGIGSGTYENKSEAGSNYTDALKEDLEKKGLLEDFVKKGEALLKKQGLYYHKNSEDKIEDILNYFVRGDVQYNDQRINEIATRHLFGANNLFQNDMMAVSADVAFDTGLNLFMPAGSVAKALKIAPVGRFNKWSRALAEVSSEHPLIGKIIRRAGSVESGTGTELLDAMSPVAGYAYRGLKTAIPGLNKIHKGAEAFANGMAKGVKNLAGFITEAPASTFKLRTAGKGVLDFAGITLKRGFSEAIEEGKQYKYGERFKEGGFAGKSNNILETLLDDFSTGTSCALAFFGSQFLGIDSDSELMQNMRGGFIGGLLNHGTVLTAYQQANNTRGQMKTGDMFIQNMLYQRILERGDIMAATNFAKYATNPNKIAQMNEAIDRILRISEENQLNSLNNPDSKYWSNEEIDGMRKLFNDVIIYANSARIQQGLKNQGIDIDSERGRAAIGLITYALNKNGEDVKIANEHIAQFNQLIENDRLSSDIFGNIASIVENIQDISTNPNLSQEEIDYLSKLHDEIKQADDAAKIKKTIEHDRAQDAAFARHYALLRLKNELTSIPEDMRSRTHKNLLLSIQHQLDKFMDLLSPIQKLIHLVLTEESLSDLGGGRISFDWMAAAYRTIALDTAALTQDGALIKSLLGEDARMFIETNSATDQILQEFDSNKKLLDELHKNIASAKKDASTYEAKRKQLIDKYLDSVRDDYKLYEQIQDSFLEALEWILATETNNEQQELAEHTVTAQQPLVQPQPKTATIDAALKLIARKAKRRRWKENKRRRQQAWEDMNDAWEEPENDELIRDLYDPVDIDELPEKIEEGLLDDYMAQYDDAWEEPWWDELTAERQAAEAEDAAFLEQYSNTNKVILERKFEVERLKKQYAVGTVVTYIDDKRRRKSFYVVGYRYNENSDTLLFGLQALTVKNTPDKRYSTRWVSEDEISNYQTAPIQLNFGNQPKSVNGIVEGKTYDILATSTADGTLHFTLGVTVEEIDDELNVHFKTADGKISQLPIDEFKKFVDDFANSEVKLQLERAGGFVDEFTLNTVADLYNQHAEQFENDPAHDKIATLKSIGQLCALATLSPRLAGSNSVDSFYYEKSVLHRRTRASYAVGDMYRDSEHERKRKAEIIKLFDTNGLENAEHTIRLLEAWYNNQLAEDQKQIIDILGKPVDTKGNDLHAGKINLSPYVELTRNGHLGAVEIDHIAHLVSREYDKPDVSSTDVINNVIERIISGQDVEFSELLNGVPYNTLLSESAFNGLVDGVRNFVTDMQAVGKIVVYTPIHVTTDTYSYENNLFVIDAKGTVQSLHFPARWYDYVATLDDTKMTVYEYNRQITTGVIGEKNKVMTERSWQTAFAAYTSPLMNTVLDNYGGVLQVPIQTHRDRKVRDSKLVATIEISKNAVQFNPAGQEILPKSKTDIESWLDEKVSPIRAIINKMLDDNTSILPLENIFKMLDVCDNIYQNLTPGVSTIEDLKALQCQLEVIRDYISKLVDDRNRELSIRLEAEKKKLNGKTNVKAEQMLPQIRTEVQYVQGIVLNIDNYTRPGGLISKQVRDTLDAFLKNEASNRYSEKLAGSKEESDKKLSNIVSQLRQQVSRILANYPNVFGQTLTAPVEAKVIADNMLVLSDSNRLELGGVLMEPDFAGTADVEIIYGKYNQDGTITKLERRSNESMVGLYAVISYKGKTYSPITILPSHYADQYNTLTEDGNSLVDEVIKQQAVGKVTAFDVHRLMPNVNYNGPMIPVTRNKVLGLTDQDLQRLTPDGSLFGMCRINGRITPLVSAQSANPLYVLNERSASNNIGGVFYMMPFDFKEYQDGSSVLPVRLLNAQLLDGDVDVILDILKELKNHYNFSSTVTVNEPYVLNGVKTPFTCIQVLRFLSNFSQDPNNSRIFINPNFTVSVRPSVRDKFGGEIDPTTPSGEKAIRDFIKSNAYQVFNHVSVLSGKLANQSDSLYKNLHSYIEQYGSLNISPSLRFDSEDLNMNDEGFYGIGWALRHGRIVTNASSIYEPSVAIGGINTPGNHPVTPQNIQPTAPQPTQPTPNIDEGLKWLMDNANPYAPSTIVATDKKLDKELALRNLRRMFGESLSVEIEDTFLDTLAGGAHVIGQTFVDSIILSVDAAYGTEYHEAFHRAVELIAGPKERKKIYDAYLKRHPELRNSQVNKIAEYMAEDFRIWMIEEKPEAVKVSWNIIKMFKLIKNWITAVRKIGSFRLAYTYYKINTGAYANILPSQENISRFNAVFGKYAPMTVYNTTTGTTTKLANITSHKDYRDAVDTISHMIIDHYLQDSAIVEAKDIDLSREGIAKLPGYSELVGNQTKKTATNKAFSEIFDNWESVQHDVIGKLKALGLGIKHNKATGKISVSKSSLDSPLDVDKINENEGYTAEGAIAEMMDYLSKESYEISRTKKIKDLVRFLLSSIKDTHWVEDGELDEDNNPIQPYVFETNSNGQYIDEDNNPIVYRNGRWECDRKDGTTVVGDAVKFKTHRNTTSTKNVFGFVKYMPFDLVYARLLSDCHHINTVQEMMSLLHEKAQTNMMYSQIYDKLSQLYNTMLYVDKDGFNIDLAGGKWRKIVTNDTKLETFVKVGEDNRPVEITESAAMQSGNYITMGGKYYLAMAPNKLLLRYNWNNVATVVQVFNAISGSKLNYKMVIEERNSESNVSYKLSDTDSGHTARRYSQSWYVSFISNPQKVQSYEHNSVVHYRLKDAQLFNRVHEFFATVTNAYVNPKGLTARTGIFVYNGRSYNVYAHTDIIKREIIQNLNSIGINIDRAAFDHLLFTTFGDVGYRGVRMYLSQNGDDSGVSRGVSIEKFIKSLKAVQKDGVFEPSLESGAFYTKNGVVALLANAKYSYNTGNKQLRVSAPGGNSYYQMSEKNTISLITELLQEKDGKTVQDFANCPYYRYIDPITGVSKSTFILDKLMSGKYRLVFDNFVGFKNSDLSTDKGRDYMQINDAEDIMSKITILESNGMVFPTMSNKKTFGHLMLIDENGRPAELPGIHFISNVNDSARTAYKAQNIPTLVGTSCEGTPITNGTYSKYSFILPDEVYDTLINYAFMEYETVKYGMRVVDELEDHEKVDNLHKPNKKSGQSSAGICRFPRFYGVFAQKPIRDKDGNIIKVDRDFINFNNNNASDETNLQTAEQYFFGQHVSTARRREMVGELIMNQLDKWLNYLELNKIIRKRQGWRSIENPYLRYESDVIDSNLLNAIIASSDNKVDGRKLSAVESKSLAIVQLLLDTHIKHQISMEEIQRLYVGHPGEFATEYNSEGRITNDMKDLSKRLGGEVSTGETNALGILGIDEEYTCTEIDDYKVSSPQADDFVKAFDESEKRATLFNTVVKKVDSVISEIPNLITGGITARVVELLNKLSEIISSGEKIGDSSIELIDRIAGIATEDPELALIETAKFKQNLKLELCQEEHNTLKDLSMEDVERLLEKDNMLAAAQARAASYARAFLSGINVGDGASYVSPRMYKNMLIQLGLFKGAVVKAFNYLEKGISTDVLANAEACRTIMDAVLGSQKYTAYGFRMEHGFPEFYYNKTALFPMFRHLCTTPKLKGVYDMMTKGDENGKNLVDMLMFKSSVKVGGKGSQPLPSNKEEYEHFKPHTYKQSFRFLIKQLNTDPKEREKMAMGTQALKVILSILSPYITNYLLRNLDGTLSDKTVTGNEILDNIMQCRKSIANINILKILTTFFDEHGIKNEQEFVSWLKNGLTDRDASDDMIRALEINPETGKRKTKLGAMSDGGWVQSIVTSLINKDLIDLNLPGNMFIQRSVFGMEGRVISDKYVPAINGGDRLKLVNEQGSMDAVISVDYFVEMFPQIKNMSFKEQRQWLIDKGIIGKTAKSQCVSYRIPTQAASSISALRFVDVLPVVRDTIVLPEEFTALTGSDFDIDKLFFSFKNLKEDESGNITDVYEKNSLEYYQNELLEQFIMLLQQDRKKFGNISLRSIDNDTEIGKFVAEEIMSNQQEVDPYDALSLWRQSQIKAENRTGSIGIGPSALNNSSQNHTRLYNVHFINSGVVRQLGLSDMSSDLDVDSRSVLGLIGAYINGHVDNAKDPWVSIVGLNPYTYNLSNMLARCGFGRSTLYFTAQPILKELAAINAYASGTLFKHRQETTEQIEQDLREDLENTYFLSVQGGISSETKKIMSSMNSYLARNIDNFEIAPKGQELEFNLVHRSYAIIKAILGMKGSARYIGGAEVEGSILRDVAIRYGAQDPIAALMDHNKFYEVDVEYNGNKETIKLSTNEVLMYMYILNNLLDPYARGVSNMVQYTKIDTKKLGKNTAAQYAYYKGYEKLENSRLFDRSLHRMLYHSYIHDLTRSSIETHRMMLRDEYIEAMDPMISLDGNNWVDAFLKHCGANPTESTVKAAVDGISSYVKYKFFKEYADSQGIRMKELFVGQNAIYNRLVQIKTAIQENPTLYKEYVDGDGGIANSLLNKLEPAWIREKDFADITKAPKFIDLIDSDEDEGATINDMRYAWQQMLEDDKHKDIQEFAKHLIVYAFVTSGDINMYGNIFKYVPYSWRTLKQRGMNKSYSDYISDFIDDGNTVYQDFVGEKNPQPIVPDRRNDIVFDDILLNNWDDPYLVPTMKEKVGNKKAYTTISLNKETNNPDVLIAATISVKQNERGVWQHTVEGSTLKSTPNVIKVHKPGHTTYNQQDFYFYRLYDSGMAVDKNGKVFTYPIYTLINPRGGVFYGHKILEYMTNQGYDWNNTGEYVDESKMADILTAVALWNESIPNAPENVPSGIWREIVSKQFLHVDSIGIDESSILTMLTVSMALNDTLNRKEKRYTDTTVRTKSAKKSKISYSGGIVTRQDAINNPRTLYIFTDNTNRTSGSNPIDRQSRYYSKYGNGQTDLYYPNKTRAVLRGLPNSMPISTQRFYDVANKLIGETGRWTNDAIEQFKQVVDVEFEAIEFEWNSGKYDNIVIAGQSLFGGNISDIRETGDRSEIYKYLKQKLNNLIVSIDGTSALDQYYYPGKPVLNSIPNWSPGSIYYAGVGSRETPQDIQDLMRMIAAELEKEGYVLRSGHANGADLAFASGVGNNRNMKEYFPEEVMNNRFGNQEHVLNLAKEVHPGDFDKFNPNSKALLARDAYLVFGEHLDSPAAFILCWTLDGVTSYESTTTATGGTGQAIRLGSRKGIPVINMADPDWRQRLDEVLQKNKPQETTEVWFGSDGKGPNAELSNMANRPFVLSDMSANRLNLIFPTEENERSIAMFIREYMNGRKFVGVEQAFQLAKLAAMYIHVSKQRAAEPLSVGVQYDSEEAELEAALNQLRKRAERKSYGEAELSAEEARIRKKISERWSNKKEESGLTKQDQKYLLDKIRKQMERIANAKTNKEAKRIGGENIGDVYGIVDSFFKGVWNNTQGKPDPTTGSYKTMGLLLIDSFMQNTKSANKLINTGNTRITHAKGGDWASAFPGVLTKTRNYVRANINNPGASVVRKDLVIPSSHSVKDQEALAASVGGVITTRQHGQKFHFGNPFSHNANWGIVTGDGTVRAAVEAFDKWLAGTDFKDVEPERRLWILDMINSGELDDVPLVYYTTNITDSEGTHVYNYDTYPNHAHILLKYINMHLANPMNDVENFASPLEAKTTLESEKTILSNEELAMWNELGILNPRILVASEHTDPAFFADLIVDIIEGRKTAAGFGKTANKFTGKDFNALYIITKHDGLPMKKILQTKIPKIIHFSVTGLGGTVWEPHTMKYNDLLDRIESFIKQGLDPKCVTLRIDPIVPGVTPQSAIEDIMRRASLMGITKIKFSICDMYGHRVAKMPDGRERIRPAAWVPALERTEKLYGKTARDRLWNTLVSIYGTKQGKPNLLNFSANPARIYQICDRMAQFAEKYGVSLSTCAESINHPKVSKEGCLSVAQVNELLGTSVEDKGAQNNTFRTECTCFGGKIDALAYTDNCATICGYCYAGHALEGNPYSDLYYNEDGTLKDLALTRTEEPVEDNKELLKFDKDALREMGAEVLKYCNKHK